MWHEQVPIDSPYAQMPWASPPDQKAGGVVASGKGQGKDKAKVFMVVSPTLTFREAAERLGCEVADMWRLYEAGNLPGVVILGQRFIEEAHLERVRTALSDNSL